MLFHIPSNVVQFEGYKNKNSECIYKLCYTLYAKKG